MIKDDFTYLLRNNCKYYLRIFLIDFRQKKYRSKVNYFLFFEKEIQYKFYIITS